MVIGFSNREQILKKFIENHKEIILIDDFQEELKKPAYDKVRKRLEENRNEIVPMLDLADALCRTIGCPYRFCASFSDRSGESRSGFIFRYPDEDSPYADVYFYSKNVHISTNGESFFMEDLDMPEEQLSPERCEELLDELFAFQKKFYDWFDHYVKK